MLKTETLTLAAPERTATAPPLPPVLPGENIISVEDIIVPKPSRTPSGLHELMRLAGAKSAATIGDFGPVLASLASDEIVDNNPEKHLYEAVFGRDSLRAAIDLIDFYPKLARTTLLTLAQNQGVGYDNASEEEPGRIPHEIRDPRVDERARMLTERFGWGWPYYGEVDGTPEFIRTLSAYYRSVQPGQDFWREQFVAKDGSRRTMKESFAAAVDWIERRLDTNKEGLLEYHRTNPNGIKNQVWKDSDDSYFHADGRIANHDQGIASVEVQRVVYDALLDAADLFENDLGDPSRAADLRSRSNSLRSAIFNLFWTEERGGYFVIGTDRNDQLKPQQMKIKTSNMGHLLKGRLLEGNEPEIVRMREAVIRQLFSEQLLGLNGIRTLASDEVRYRPGAYHNGSVWIWDNYVISQGLSQQGYHSLAHLINDKLLDVVNSTNRFPEFARGDNDPENRLNVRVVKVLDSKNNFENTVIQPPQDIQAWSVAAIVSLKFKRAQGQRMTTDSRKAEVERQILESIEFGR
jgi:glycogen debranching enzyme